MLFSPVSSALMHTPDFSGESLSVSYWQTFPCKAIAYAESGPISLIFFFLIQKLKAKNNQFKKSSSPSCNTKLLTGLDLLKRIRSEFRGFTNLTEPLDQSVSYFKITASESRPILSSLEVHCEYFAHTQFGCTKTCCLHFTEANGALTLKECIDKNSQHIQTAFV